uniref:ditrans,polycis-polyprenyl diphosphate synthase [(2E,6E)-farnesyldiphosphate specific] n=1 Tax=Arcella intermedia TaxID=1963864 RepID=A0A6B2LES7_9EUKA
MAIVLDDNDALNNSCQLVNVVTWCVAAGIPNLTLYDHQGILKQNLVTLKRELEARRDFFFGSKKRYQYKFVDSPIQNVERHMKLNVNVNGIVDGLCGAPVDTSSVRICVTSAEDGQETIIKILQKLALQINNEKGLNDTLDLMEEGSPCQNGKTDIINFKLLLDDNGNIQKTKIHKLLENTLSQVNGQYWPPPDFILKFGNPTVWTGFLPWHMRYSEILFTGCSLSNFNFGTFIKSLDKFNQCGRRFGK